MDDGYGLVGAKSREVAAMLHRKEANQKNLITCEKEFNMDDSGTVI